MTSLNPSFTCLLISLLTSCIASGYAQSPTIAVPGADPADAGVPVFDPMYEPGLHADAPSRRPEQRGTLYATYGPYTHHQGKGPYNARPNFRALEWESAQRWMAGGAAFRNSFGQECWYAFAGKKFVLKHRSGRFFAKVTGGLMHGYQSPHRGSVPLNCKGYNPAILPSIGYQYKNVNFQLVVFGRAYGAMPMVGCALR
jgi:hypothetical protein